VDGQATAEAHDVKALVERIERALGAIDRVVRVIVVTALLSMTAVLFLNSIGRSALNVSFVGGPALGRLLVIWLTFLGAYLAVRSGKHIRVDVLQRLLSGAAMARLTVLAACAGALTTAYVAWLGAAFTWTRFAAGQVDPMLEIPSALFYLPVPIGASLMALAFAQAALNSAFGENAAPAQDPAAPDGTR
jgi:C4-dicarboxylate transporter DctQ subunit